jgi:hypothetical protein
VAGVRLPAGTRNFSLLHSVQTGCRSHASSCRMGVGSVFPWVKWPWRETVHPIPSGAEVKNGGAINPLPISLQGVMLK